METNMVGQWVHWFEQAIDRNGDAKEFEKQGEIVAVEYAREEKRFVVLVKVYTDGKAPSEMVQAYADKLTMGRHR